MAIHRMNVPGLTEVVIIEWHSGVGQVWVHPVPGPRVQSVQATMIADGINTMDQAKQIAGVWRHGYWHGNPPTGRHLSVKLPATLFQMGDT